MSSDQFNMLLPEGGIFLTVVEHWIANIYGLFDHQILPPFVSNTKGHTVSLFALVDAEYCYRYIDIGKDGCSSDRAILKNSTLNLAMQNNLLYRPEGGVCVGDDGFPLRSSLLKPFSHRNVSLEKSIYNYRSSRARRLVKKAFEILARKF